MFISFAKWNSEQYIKWVYCHEHMSEYGREFRVKTGETIYGYLQFAKRLLVQWILKNRLS